MKSTVHQWKRRGTPCFNLKQPEFLWADICTVKSTHSFLVKKRTDGRKLHGKLLENKVPPAIIATHLIDMNLRMPKTSKHHKMDPNMLVNAAALRQQKGWRWSIGQLGQPFTAPDHRCSLGAWPRPWPESSPVPSDTVSYRRRGACLHQMTPEPKSRGSDGGEDRWHACRSVHLKGGRRFKRGLWAAWGVCECVYSCVKGGGCQPCN